MYNYFQSLRSQIQMATLAHVIEQLDKSSILQYDVYRMRFHCTCYKGIGYTPISETAHNSRKQK